MFIEQCIIISIVLMVVAILLSESAAIFLGF